MGIEPVNGEVAREKMILEDGTCLVSVSFLKQVS